MNRWKGSALAAALLSAAVAVLLVPSPAAAADTKGPESGAWAGRAYDLRSTIPTLQTFAANPVRDAAIASWRTALPDLAVTRDERTGAVRSLMNRGGYLTGQRYGSAEAIAVDFVRGEVDLFGLSVEDLDDYEVAKLVPSKAAGLTHVVLRQRHNGYPLYNAPLQVSVKDDGADPVGAQPVPPPSRRGGESGRAGGLAQAGRSERRRAARRARRRHDVPRRRGPSHVPPDSRRRGAPGLDLRSRDRRPAELVLRDGRRR